MKDTKLTYSKAIARLDEIVRQIEEDEQDIDQLTDRLKEAKELIAFCKDKLYKVDKSVKEIIQADEDQ